MSSTTETDTPRSRDPAVRRIALVSLACAVVAVAAAVGLVALPYSTSLILPATLDGASTAPGPEFEVGRLRWPVETWSTAPELESFRERFRLTCGTKTGADAGVCVSELMARSFPNGPATAQFVDPVFDPALHMDSHLEGQSGHCMNRTAIMAGQLLSVGVPARVVQVMNPELFGHTLVEVWDGDAGWTLMDPTFNLVLSRPGRPPSAWALVSDNDSVTWRSLGAPPEGGAAEIPVTTWADGTVLYPEPWLYLRVGTREAPWPYRGQYASLGPRRLALGPLQWALGALAIVASLGVAASLGLLLRKGLLTARSSALTGQGTATT